MKPSDYHLIVVSPYSLNPLLRDTFSQGNTHMLIYTKKLNELTYYHYCIIIIIVTCVKNAKEALIQLQQHGHSKSTPITAQTAVTKTLLLIDMENDHRNIVSLKMLVHHLRQGTVINFVPLGNV